MVEILIPQTILDQAATNVDINCEACHTAPNNAMESLALGCIDKTFSFLEEVWITNGIDANWFIKDLKQECKNCLLSGKPRPTLKDQYTAGIRLRLPEKD